MKNIIAFILLLIFTNCSTNSEDISFQEISFGICNLKVFIPIDYEGSPSGKFNHSSHSSVKIVKKSDTIPAEPDVVFGISYQVNSKTNEEIELKQLWTPPTPIVDNEGKSFENIEIISDATPNHLIYSYYILEKEYEIIKGEWKIQLFHKGKVIHEKKFILI